MTTKRASTQQVELVTGPRPLGIAPSTTVTISAPNMAQAEFTCIGTSPLVINRFPAKAEAAMRAAQEAGGQAKSKKNREAKDFKALFEAASYRDPAGWYGINASAFRQAMGRASSKMSAGIGWGAFKVQE